MYIRYTGRKLRGKARFSPFSFLPPLLLSPFSIMEGSYRKAFYSSSCKNAIPNIQKIIGAR